MKISNIFIYFKHIASHKGVVIFSLMIIIQIYR